MKRTLLVVAYVVSCVLLCALIVSCKTSPEALEARRSVLDSMAGALTDGVLTQAEVEDIQAGFDAYEAAPKGGTPGWLEPVTTVVGSLAAGFLGLRYMPNRYILGSSPDPEVARAAGLPAPGQAAS